jgi:hypothetical protein
LARENTTKGGKCLAGPQYLVAGEWAIFLIKLLSIKEIGSSLANGSPFLQGANGPRKSGIRTVLSGIIPQSKFPRKGWGWFWLPPD